MNPKYDVIFCVRVKLQGGLCGKATRNKIAYLGKRGQFVKGYVCPLIPDYVDRKHFLHAIAAAAGCVGIVSSSGSNN